MMTQRIVVREILMLLGSIGTERGLCSEAVRQSPLRTPRLIPRQHGPRRCPFQNKSLAEAGGGIRSSIDGVRKASKTALTQKVSAVLADLAGHGTTTVEAKSGYGLSLESELKSLEAIRAAARQWPGTVVPTFLGAHAVPPEYSGRSQSYVEIVCKEMLPAVAKRELAKFVDVFCDRGAFSEIECSTIFGAALEHGFAVRAHLGQLSSPKPGFIEATLECCRPTTFDLIDYIRDHAVTAPAKSATGGTFVAGSNQFLGLEKDRHA